MSSIDDTSLYPLSSKRGPAGLSSSVGGQAMLVSLTSFGLASLVLCPPLVQSAMLGTSHATSLPRRSFIRSCRQRSISRRRRRVGWSQRCIQIIMVSQVTKAGGWPTVRVIQVSVIIPSLKVKAPKLSQTGLFLRHDLQVCSNSCVSGPNTGEQGSGLVNPGPQQCSACL